MSRQLRRRAPRAPKIVKDDFVYTLRKADDNGDGEIKISLPSMTYLPPKIVREIRKLEEYEAVWTVIEASLTASEMAEFDATVGESPELFESFLEAWNEHSGVDLGES